MKQFTRRALSSLVSYAVSAFIIAFTFSVAAETRCMASDPAVDYEIRDLESDTWFAVDALNRTTPTFEEVGGLRNDHRRVVGIFYITWHLQKYVDLPAPYAYDVTKVLTEDPNARLNAESDAWKHHWGYFHWGEPETGYYLSQDEYIIRRDMSELVDAGVDVVILDVTNAVFYWDEWDKIFATMAKMRSEGNKTPQFCFWAFNGKVITIVQKLYERYYKQPQYQDLWFYWDGKPLLLCNFSPTKDSYSDVPINSPNPNYDPEARTNPEHPHYLDPDYCEPNYLDYTKEVKDFFTLRCMWFGYYHWAGKRFIGTEDNWSYGYDFCDSNIRAMTPTELLSLHNGVREQAAVSPAQHPMSLVGKSWSRANGEPELDEQDMPKPTYVPWLGKTVEHPEGYGIYYQERWDDALAADPQFVYLNDWNEWTAIRSNTPRYLHEMNFMRRGEQAQYFFVDQYNAEFNRTIQPMKGGYTDNYYMQTVENIRRYKGARQTPENVGFVEVKDGESTLDVWNSVQVEYRDTVGDVIHRDTPGYSGERYVDNSGRNDFVTCKVGVDSDNLYFLAETRDAWTPSTDPNWALLLINADQNYQTGWFGYDYIINKRVVDNAHTTLCRWVENETSPDHGRWEEIQTLEYAVNDNRLAVTLPRQYLGAVESEVRFDFKWSDNPTELKDPISLCVAGDAAPNRRFNYRFVWKESQTKE